MNESRQDDMLRELLQESIGEQLYQIVLSNSREKEKISRQKIRPVLVKSSLKYQVSSFVGTKVFHENLEAGELIQAIIAAIQQTFRQAEITCRDFRATVLVSKKGKMTIQKKRQQSTSEAGADWSHNREKRYILPEGTAVPFLVDLGVQTPEGKIVRSKYDKYRQINRYLELIEDILPILPKERTVHIIDFGCGKSYLTFALYYYLKELKKYDISVTGLDLKEDVIDYCNELRTRYGYNELRFIKGDIASYEGAQRADMVVSLHACDTATDYALQKAVQWQAAVILSVPCCQHELNRQIRNDILQPVLKYGLLKERIAALLTDGIRANLLEQMGYETQLLEFIDMEHTPKNILIRAIRRNEPAAQSEELKRLLQELHVQPTLEKLLQEE